MVTGAGAAIQAIVVRCTHSVSCGDDRGWPQVLLIGGVACAWHVQHPGAAGAVMCCSGRDVYHISGHLGFTYALAVCWRLGTGQP